MSSKNAESLASPQTGSKAKRVWSITGRFTALYVASTAVLLLLAVGYLYWALKRNLDARDHALLASKVQVIRLLLREQPAKREALVSEVEHEATEGPLRYYLRILDGADQPLIETPGMSERLPVWLFPAPVLASSEAPGDLERSTRHHEALLLLAVQIQAGDAGHPLRTLQIAFDTSNDQALLTDYRRTLLTVLGVGLIFAVVVGRWLARKGAQPLVEITRSAQHITASQLQERIAESGWPAELAELAGAFNAMLDRLEDSFARLSQFSGDLAHELRTPISNLRCQVEVALNRGRDPQEYQQILTSSLEEYERLSRMIDGLLFIARADNPKAEVKRVRFDARKEIEAVRDFYEALAAEHEVAVVCEGQAELTGDPVLFGRAISNVLGNALHYTPPKGNVCITICPPQNGTVEIRVRDTGVGMAAEHVPKVFDRFYRADPSRSQARGGTGLGLPIVQSILRLHGGNAFIESQLGQGTTVILRFPVGGMASPDAKMATM